MDGTLSGIVKPIMHTAFWWDSFLGRCHKGGREGYVMVPVTLR
jgi:hypothetical protein